MVGNTLHYGAGAGADATASAVIADIADLVRSMDAAAHNRVPQLGFLENSMEPIEVLDCSRFESAYYLRAEVNDVAGVMSQLSSVFADHSISLEAITQKEPAKDETAVSVIFITQRTIENNITDAIAKLEAMKDVIGKVTRIRVEHLD